MTSHEKPRKKKSFLRIIATILAILICLAGAGVAIGFLLSKAGILKNPNSPINTIVGKFTDREVTDGTSAILAVQEIADAFGYTNATDELTISSENTVDNLSYYKLQQNYKGIPVYGNAIIVVADVNGEAKGLTGNALDVDESISLVPTVEQEVVAKNVADCFETAAPCPKLTDDLLTIYQNKEKSTSTLAYSFTVFAENAPYSVVVDANSGEVLKCTVLSYTNTSSNTNIPTNAEMLKERVDIYNAEGKKFCEGYITIDGIQHISDQKNIYDWTGRLQYTINNGIIRDLNGKAVDNDRWNWETIRPYLLEETGENSVKHYFLDTMDEETGVSGNSRANALITELATAHGFFSTIFEINGYDNAGGRVLGVFDDVLHNKNAACSPNDCGDYFISFIIIGTNMPITTDLVAHEYTHAVEASISFMTYVGESGAIMEGYSDVFGELVEDWKTDNELDGKGCDWVCVDRNIQAPHESDNPDTYKDKSFWKSTNDRANDHGGVHTNSTVISHAAYLMTHPTDESMTSLTAEKLARLWYNTLFTLPHDCSFNTLGQNMLLTAKSLEFTEDEIKCITAAFDEVKINSESNYETYSTNPQLSVTVDKSKRYDDYTIEIFSVADENTKRINIIEVDNDAPVKLELSEGTYIIKVCDAKNPEKTCTKIVKISQKSKNSQITFATNFGDNNADTANTKSEAATARNKILSDIIKYLDWMLRLDMITPEEYDALLTEFKVKLDELDSAMEDEGYDLEEYDNLFEAYLDIIRDMQD